MFYFLLNLLFFCFTTCVGTFVWNGVDIIFRVFRDDPKSGKIEEKILNNMVSGCHAYFVVYLDILKYLVGFNFSPIYFHIFLSQIWFILLFLYKTNNFALICSTVSMIVSR